MRVDGRGDILGQERVLDGQRAFRDQLSGAGPDDPDAEDPARGRVDHELRQSVRAAPRGGPAPAGPPATSVSVKTTAGTARLSKAAGRPAMASAATLPWRMARWASMGSPVTSPTA